MNRDEAVRKAAALLRLAERGATPGEVAAAAARAQDLMDRWHLTRDVLPGEHASPTPEEPEAPVNYMHTPEGWLEARASYQPWRGVLARGVASCQGCYVIRSSRGPTGRRRTIEIIGGPSNVDAVRYLFPLLAREIERLTDTHGRGMGRSWRNSFALGAATVVCERLREQRVDTIRAVRAEHAPNPHALAVVNRAIAVRDEAAAAARRHAWSTCRLVNRSAAGPSNMTAHHAGRRAGASITIGGRHAALPGSRRKLPGC